MFEAWFTLIKISFGVAILWMILELLFRPLIKKHALKQMVDSARKCYAILLACKTTIKVNGETDDSESINFALSQYKDSISKQPRLSKQTGHAEMYQKIRKLANERSWANIDDLLDDLGKLDASIADQEIAS